MFLSSVHTLSFIHPLINLLNNSFINFLSEEPFAVEPSVRLVIADWLEPWAIFGKWPQSGLLLPEYKVLIRNVILNWAEDKDVDKNTTPFKNQEVK